MREGRYLTDGGVRVAVLIDSAHRAGQQTSSLHNGDVFALAISDGPKLGACNGAGTCGLGRVLPAG